MDAQNPFSSLLLHFLLSVDGLIYQNRMMFTTKDRDNDKKTNANCAKEFYGGWWYNACHHSNLNDLYTTSALIDPKYAALLHWKSKHEALKTTLMMIRPS